MNPGFLPTCDHYRPLPSTKWWRGEHIGLTSPPISFLCISHTKFLVPFRNFPIWYSTTPISLVDTFVVFQLSTLDSLAFTSLFSLASFSHTRIFCSCYFMSLAYCLLSVLEAIAIQFWCLSLLNIRPQPKLTTNSNHLNYKDEVRQKEKRTMKMRWQS